MNQKTSRKALSIAIAGLGAGIAMSAPASADMSNPFGATELNGGYMQLADAKAKKEGSCGEGKCGEDKKAKTEGSCGEGKCGEDKKAKTEGSCGEGKCGEDKKAKTEGKCGEGKCGEGKCGEGKCGGA